VEAAITADPSLLDREAVGEAIFRARHGDERWKKHVEHTHKHGIGVLDYPSATPGRPTCPSRASG
jgi:hypothetical protein